MLIQATAPGATFATDSAIRQAVSQVAASLAALPNYATSITTPLSAGGQALVSKDGRSALVTFDVPGNVNDVNQAASALQHAVATVQDRHPDLRVAETGDASIAQAINNSLNFGKAEGTSVPVTLILLLIVFGALVAAGIPVLLALTAVTASLGVLTIVSHWLPVNGSTFEVVVIVGMAVGVDYSLFYLRGSARSGPGAGRSRGAPRRRAHLGPHDGRVRPDRDDRDVRPLPRRRRAVQWHGPRHDRRGGHRRGRVAHRAAHALLAWLGPKADAGRIPFLGRSRAAARPSRLWTALARRVVARPVIWGGVAVVVALLALAARALGLRLGEPAADAPKDAAVIRADGRHRARVPARTSRRRPRSC